MNTSLPPPSAEQIASLDVWRAGGNQVCVATAGAGKSTLLLHACAASTEPVLIVTYNKALHAPHNACISAAARDCVVLHELPSRK